MGTELQYLGASSCAVLSSIAKVELRCGQALRIGYAVRSVMPPSAATGERGFLRMRGIMRGLGKLLERSLQRGTEKRFKVIENKSFLGSSTAEAIVPRSDRRGI